MKTLLQDLRYALRSFSQNRAFTVAVLASLAIGIGANTALFSVTNALLLRPLPYQDAERLVILWNRSPGLNITEDWFSTAQYFDIKNQGTFEQAAIAIGGNENLTGDGQPERIGAIHVSSNLLPMLGVRAARGRLFTADEDQAGRPRTVVLSDGMWKRRYGSDPQMIGRTLIVNGEAHEVVGILPASFSLPREVLPTLGGAEQAEILLALPLAADAAQVRTREDYNVLAKLKPGVTVSQAQAEMDVLTARLRHDFPQVYPPNGGLTFGVVALQEQVVGDIRRALWILTGAVGFVLLISCANVANLLLARAVARQKEIAVRQALGAGGGRIVRQLLSESIFLALCGGVLGVLLAIAGTRWLSVLGPKSIPRLYEVGMHGEVLLFTLLLCVFSGVLFGLAPAWRLSRLDLHTSLVETSRGSSGMSAVWGRGSKLRKLLVVAQLGLSVVLLIGAGLLLRSFWHLQCVYPGFNVRNVLTFELTMTGGKYKERQPRIDAYRRLCEGLSQLSGVTAAGAVSSLPLSELMAWGPITVEGRTPLPGENFINVDQRISAGQYFEAMKIPLVRGRLFNEQDTAENPRVALIDTFMASELWPGQDAVGKRFHFGGLNEKNPWVTVVGVVGRVKQYTLDADGRIALYLPHAQNPAREMNVVVRSTTDPRGLAAAAKEQVQHIDPDLPMYSVRTMETRLASSLARRRFSLAMLGLFAGLALVLATLGIYGVMDYLVAQGTREIGIRMALGATPTGILRLIVRQGLALALLGVALGLGGAFAATHLLQSLLFGVKATDPLTFCAIAALLAGVALLATYLPARRAASVDPMDSLRWE